MPLFFYISEHADGERRGACADLKTTRGRDLAGGYPSDPSWPLDHNYIVMADKVMADGYVGSVVAPRP